MFGSTVIMKTEKEIGGIQNRHREKISRIQNQWTQ